MFFFLTRKYFTSIVIWYLRKQALDIEIHPKPMFAMNILILETLPPKVHAYT